MCKHRDSSFKFSLNGGHSRAKRYFQREIWCTDMCLDSGTFLVCSWSVFFFGSHINDHSPVNLPWFLPATKPQVELDAVELVRLEVWLDALIKKPPTSDIKNIPGIWYTKYIDTSVLSVYISRCIYIYIHQIYIYIYIHTCKYCISTRYIHYIYTLYI